MRFLADENVEQAVVEALRAGGHDVVEVGKAAPGAKDREVLGLAREEQRVLVTNDRDFGELVYREGWVATGLVLIRCGAGRGTAKASVIAGILPEIESRLEGHFVVISEQQVRVRPLREYRKSSGAPEGQAQGE